jgi:hypothetical protein
MSTRALPVGSRRLLINHQDGLIDEVVITAKDSSPGWYYFTHSDGTLGQAKRDRLYADTPEAREFLEALAHLARIENEAEEAASTAGWAVRNARQAEIDATRTRAEVLQRSGKLF